MNVQCSTCGKQMQRIALPGQMDSFRCLPCTPTTVQLPTSPFKTKRKAAVLENYQDMPLPGENDGDTYLITSMNAVCRWDAEKEDYQILQLDAFKWPKPEDEFNNRRGAILAQRARKSRSHG